MNFQAKLCLFLAVLLLVPAMLFSCGGKTEEGIPVPSGMQAIASEAGDYYLMVPAAWTVDTTKGMTSAYAEDAAKSSVTVCANELTRDIVTIEQYWESFSEQFKATFADFAMIDAEPTDVVLEKAEAEGKKYRYTATVGDVKYQWMQVLFIRNATLYIVTYTSTAESYESNLDDVNKILGELIFR